MAQWAGTEREERDEQGVMNNREKEGECGFDRKETSESILPSHRDTHTRTLIHATKTIHASSRLLLGSHTFFFSRLDSNSLCSFSRASDHYFHAQ